MIARDQRIHGQDARCKWHDGRGCGAILAASERPSTRDSEKACYLMSMLQGLENMSKQTSGRRVAWKCLRVEFSVWLASCD